MKRIRAIDENEMVAVFLGCELDSPRFGDGLQRLLAGDGQATTVIVNPDLANEGECAYRRQLLGRVRGFKQGRALFRDFPEDVQWERAILTLDELWRARYINYDYWLELSGGSRKPADSARRIEEGVEVFRQSNDSFWNAVNALRSGVAFREMIFVSHDGRKLVVIEGHVRLTSFMLAPELLPQELEVILGRSADLSGWPLY